MDKWAFYEVHKFTRDATELDNYAGQQTAQVIGFMV
jgi:hypothetical protein